MHTCHTRFAHLPSYARNSGTLLSSRHCSLFCMKRRGLLYTKAGSSGAMVRQCLRAIRAERVDGLAAVHGRLARQLQVPARHRAARHPPAQRALRLACTHRAPPSTTPLHRGAAPRRACIPGRPWPRRARAPSAPGAQPRRLRPRPVRHGRRPHRAPTGSAPPGRSPAPGSAKNPQRGQSADGEPAQAWRRERRASPGWG
jgi:hypothetical protein